MPNGHVHAAQVIKNITFEMCRSEGLGLRGSKVTLYVNYIGTYSLLHEQNTLNNPKMTMA